jgi:DNA-binding NarL/FixJ family response regulator
MLRTMLVDDNPLFLAALQKLLATMDGIEVVATATSGAQAVTEVERLAPDLVLLDLMMPGMHGLDAMRAIRRLARVPQVVIITLHDTADYRDEARNSGALALISKQALDEELPPLVADLIGTGQPARCNAPAPALSKRSTS